MFSMRAIGLVGKLLNKSHKSRLNLIQEREAKNDEPPDPDESGGPPPVETPPRGLSSRQDSEKKLKILAK